jgi:hypothetical protein
MIPLSPTAVAVLEFGIETPKSHLVVPLLFKKVHVTPPSVLFQMKPPFPTMVPLLASENETLLRLAVGEINWPTHVAPPSVVLRTLELLPTITPVFESKKKTPLSMRFVPLV